MDFGGDHFGDLVPQVAEPNQETDNRGSGSFVSQFIEAMPFMGGGFSHEDGEYVHSESTSPAPSPSDRPSNKRKANDNAALDDAHRFARRHRSVGSSNSPGSSIFHSPPQATPFTPLGLGVGTSASPESRLASSSFGGTVPGAGGGGVSGSGGGLLAHGNHPLARGTCTRFTSRSDRRKCPGPRHPRVPPAEPVPEIKNAIPPHSAVSIATPCARLDSCAADLLGTRHRQPRKPALGIPLGIRASVSDGPAAAL
eukprot:Rmarinus@m.979